MVKLFGSIFPFQGERGKVRRNLVVQSRRRTAYHPHLPFAVPAGIGLIASLPTSANPTANARSRLFWPT